MTRNWALRYIPAAFLLALTACSRNSSESRDASPSDIESPATYQARLETSKGPIVIDVNRSWAPHGADRFYMLTKRGFYDQARFFRVMPGFIIQFGMHAVPEENAKWANAEIQDDPVVQHNVKGTVSFAARGPNTRTSQIFINLGDNTNSLDPQGFAVFGHVSQGMDLVEQLYAGYGEMPEQQMITARGNAYLMDGFPKLDYIQKATVRP